MLGKLSVALLLAASPALANDPAPATAAPAQDYKIKKVCRTVEVAGSSIPRRHCVNKKIPVKKAEAPAEQAAKTVPGTAEESAGEQKEQ